MSKLGFKRLASDSCLYISQERNLIIILYVDDILIFGETINQIKWIKVELTKNFQMKDLNEVNNFLGFDIKYNKEIGKMVISQESYVNKILDKFGMKDCKPVNTPMDPNLKWRKSENITDAPFKALLGCLQYLALVTRPDLTISVGLLSQFQSAPGEIHWTGLKRILRYLQGTKKMRLTYNRSTEPIPLIGYADADYANDEEGRKSNSGNVFMVFGNTVSWSSKRQQIVTLSSTEAELVSLCNAAKEGIWLSHLLSEIGINSNPFTIYEDNIPCIRIAEEPREHQRTKHVDVKYMYIRELIKNKKLRITYVSSDNQIADFFTKPLAKCKFDKFLNCLKMQN